MRKIIFLLLGLVFLLLPSQSFAQQGLEVAGQPNPVKEAYFKGRVKKFKKKAQNGWSDTISTKMYLSPLIPEKRFR